MGATQSTISPEKFRDQIFSLILYHVAPQANPNLKFVTRDLCRSDFLPIPDDPDLNQLLNFYDVRDPHVKNYLNQHVLNSEENVVRFYQTLINLIRQQQSSSNSSSNHAKYDQKISKQYRQYLKNQPRRDRLTRSHLNRIESEPPSLSGGSFSNQKSAKQRDAVRESRLYLQRSSQQQSSHRRPDRNSEKPTHSALNHSSFTNRSSHFTLTKLVEEDDRPNLRDTSEKTPDLDQVRQKLIVNLLNRSPSIGDDELSDDHQSESQKSESQKSEPQKSEPRKSEDHRSEPRKSESRQSEPAKQTQPQLISEQSSLPSHQRGPLNRSRRHNRRDSFEANDESTIKHQHRFKEKCMIQEDFD